MPGCSFSREVGSRFILVTPQLEASPGRLSPKLQKLLPAAGSARWEMRDTAQGAIPPPARPARLWQESALEGISLCAWRCRTASSAPHLRSCAISDTRDHGLRPGSMPPRGHPAGEGLLGSLGLSRPKTGWRSRVPGGPLKELPWWTSTEDLMPMEEIEV